MTEKEDKAILEKWRLMRSQYGSRIIFDPKRPDKMIYETAEEIAQKEDIKREGPKPTNERA